MSVDLGFGACITFSTSLHTILVFHLKLFLPLMDFTIAYILTLNSHTWAHLPTCLITSLPTLVFILGCIHGSSSSNTYAYLAHTKPSVLLYVYINAYFHQPFTFGSWSSLGLYGFLISRAHKFEFKYLPSRTWFPQTRALIPTCNTLIL